MNQQRMTAAQYRATAQSAKSEDQIHIEIVRELTRILPDDAMIIHARNEGNRGGAKGAIDGARGKAMGVKPGFPDLLLYVDGSGYCIEVKRPGEGLSEIQKLVAQELARHSIPHVVCRSVEDARSAVARWGIKTTERPA